MSIPVTKTIVISPPSGWRNLALREVWDYRQLLWFLVKRDIFTVYRQTVLGVGWALIGPVMTMVIFTFIFSKVVQVPSENLPYPLFAFAALTPWTYFSTCTTRCTNSLLENAAILTKVYFPRIILVITPLFFSLLNFVISFVVLVFLMFFYGVPPNLESIIMLPLFLLLAALTGFTIGLWFAPLNVMFRDVAQAMPFFIQFLLYATPIAYPLSIVPERFQTLLQLNPLTHVVNGFRWALLGANTAPDPKMALISTGIVMVLFVAGLYWFRRMENVFADVI